MFKRHKNILCAICARVTTTSDRPSPIAKIDMKYEWFGEEETDDSVRKKNSLSSVVDLRMSSTGQRPLVTMYILARISLQYDVEPNSHQRLCQSLSKLFVLLYQITNAWISSNSEQNVSHFENPNEYTRDCRVSLKFEFSSQSLFCPSFVF